MLFLLTQILVTRSMLCGDIQGSTISVRRVRTYAYLYWRTHILNMRTLRRTRIFSLYFTVFKIALVLRISHCLKTYCYKFDLYLFALGRDRFFTIYICSKETYLHLF